MDLSNLWIKEGRSEGYEWLVTYSPMSLATAIQWQVHIQTINSFRLYNGLYRTKKKWIWHYAQHLWLGMCWMVHENDSGLHVSRSHVHLCSKLIWKRIRSQIGISCYYIVDLIEIFFTLLSNPFFFLSIPLFSRGRGRQIQIAMDTQQYRLWYFDSTSIRSCCPVVKK